MSAGKVDILVMPVPSLRVSGGNKEAVRLAEDLRAAGVDIRIVALWRSPYELVTETVPVVYLSSFLAERSNARLQYPILLLRFLLYIVSLRGNAGPRLGLMLTHFSTFPLAWLAPRSQWYCFNQDIEWMFVAAGFKRALLRKLILATSRRASVVTTNNYVSSLYREEGILPIGQVSIWPPKSWLLGEPRAERRNDVVMLVRGGLMKRMDLYLDMLEPIGNAGFSSLVVTPDPKIFERFTSLGYRSVLRPNDKDLRGLYRESKIFLLLSDTEGFALPPLEAMGSGCVPLCRDCGGPRCYMTGALASNLVPLDETPVQIFARLQSLLADVGRLDVLSRHARSVFEAGLVSSKVERSACIATLVGNLQAGTREESAEEQVPAGQVH